MEEFGTARIWQRLCISTLDVAPAAGSQLCRGTHPRCRKPRTTRRGGASNAATWRPVPGVRSGYQRVRGFVRRAAPRMPGQPQLASVSGTRRIGLHPGLERPRNPTPAATRRGTTKARRFAHAVVPHAPVRAHECSLRGPTVSPGAVRLPRAGFLWTNRRRVASVAFGGGKRAPFRGMATSSTATRGIYQSE